MVIADVMRLVVIAVVGEICGDCSGCRDWWWLQML